VAVIVADTDVLIDFLAGREPTAEHVALAIERGQLQTTTVTRVEMLAGARTMRELQTVRALLQALPTLTLDEAAADRAADVKRDLERRGQPIGMADCLIAGIVLAHDGVLLTRNERHFARVPGLALATSTPPR
jgi:tRNA(fMet)-specific endonuclease VapC